MDSEKIATNHVELAISKADHLVSHINSKGRALSKLAVHFNGAVMGFHNGFCQRQTQPDALCIL